MKEPTKDLFNQKPKTKEGDWWWDDGKRRGVLNTNLSSNGQQLKSEKPTHRPHSKKDTIIYSFILV